MTRYIVHESGVIFDASECVLVDTDQFDDHDMARLSGDDYFDDSVVDEIAERCGVAIPDAVDSARWLALKGLPGFFPLGGWWPCASCESVGAPRRLVNVRVAAVVPWDVMGDSRAFAFVCDGCASGSAVVL